MDNFVLFAYEVIFDFHKGLVFIFWNQSITKRREAKNKLADLKDAKTITLQDQN